MRSYSQSGQDVYAYATRGGKNNGTFLDLGCNDPIVNNNSYALELLGWSGLCVDILPFDYSGRKTPFVQHNAALMFPELAAFIDRSGGFVDYLSLDCDDATMEVLVNLPLNRLKFGVITIENDQYRIGPKQQNDIYELLISHGYLRSMKDVRAPIVEGMPWSGQPYEDFYFRP